MPHNRTLTEIILDYYSEPLQNIIPHLSLTTQLYTQFMFIIKTHTIDLKQSISHPTIIRLTINEKGSIEMYRTPHTDEFYSTKIASNFLTSILKTHISDPESKNKLEKTIRTTISGLGLLNHNIAPRPYPTKYPTKYTKYQ